MIYEFLADGFELVEAMTPLDMLRRAGANVKTVSISRSKSVKSSNGVTVEADILLGEADLGHADMLILPGGMPGAKNLRECDELCSMIVEANEKGLPIGAICAAPYILGELGLLKGKTAICYPGFEDSLTGAHLSPANVCRDGSIITAAGMGVALRFSCELVTVLYGEQKTQEILRSIMA